MARSIWTGSVSFGLVNIPVKVFSAIHEHTVHFHQIAPDGSRIHQKRVSEKTGREVDYDDIKKGYETSKGHYVLVEPDELTAIAPKTTKTIDIDEFVALEDIDPIYFNRTYYLAPSGEGAARSYALLASVMEERGRVGIGKVVMREKQYLAAIRPYGKGLALSTMLFADEVVAPSDIADLPTRRPSVSAREKKLATQILDSLESDWKPERYHDDYQEQVRKLIKAKAKGKTIEAPEAEQPAKVLDLMEALRASLEGGKKTTPTRTGTKKAAKKTTRKSAPRSTKRTKPQSSKRTSHRKAS